MCQELSQLEDWKSWDKSPPFKSPGTPGLSNRNRIATTYPVLSFQGDMVKNVKHVKLILPYFIEHNTSK
jgi:hypothetical protein